MDEYETNIDQLKILHFISGYLEVFPLAQIKSSLQDRSVPQFPMLDIQVSGQYAHKTLMQEKK